jgi:hypothetical protein
MVRNEHALASLGDTGLSAFVTSFPLRKIPEETPQLTCINNGEDKEKKVAF